MTDDGGWKADMSFMMRYLLEAGVEGFGSILTKRPGPKFTPSEKWLCSEQFGDVRRCYFSQYIQDHAVAQFTNKMEVQCMLTCYAV